MSENFANHYITTLTAFLDDDDLTCTVASVTGVPSVPFRAVIGRKGAYAEEIVIVTNVTGKVFTITRAAEATAGVQTAWKHPVGATITAVLTAAVMTSAFTQGVAISDLTAVATPATTDLFLVSQGGNSKKLARSQMSSANVLALAGGSDAAAIVTAFNSLLAGMKTALLMDADPATYQSIILATTGLAAYWRLGEPSGVTADDEVGALDGTYTGGPTLGAAGLLAGNADTAVTLLGGGDFIGFGTDATFSIATTGELTIEAWIKPTGVTGLQIIANRAWWSPGHQEYQFALVDDELDMTVYESGGIVAHAAGGTIGAGSTYHVAVTVDNGTLFVLYVNGAEVARDDTWVSPVTNTATDNFEAGRNSVTGAGEFTGTIDELAVYSVALSAADVLAHYEAGS